MRFDTSCNQANFILDGNNYFRALHRMICSVERQGRGASIRLAYWKADPSVMLPAVAGKPQRTLAEALVAASRAGARVQVILWNGWKSECFVPHHHFWRLDWSEFVNKWKNILTQWKVPEGGLEFKYHSYAGSTLHPFTSLHVKIALFETASDKTVLLGGLNLGEDYKSADRHDIQNSVVEAANSYEYDALYRLIEATGREHASQGTSQRTHEQLPVGPQPMTSDPSAMRRYTQKYSYDSVGNILTMQHIPASGSGWTRYYQYDDAGNRLEATSAPGDDPQGPYTHTYSYDNHGSMTAMPHLSSMIWNHDDELQEVTVGTETVYFQYAGGMRSRKYTEKQGTTTEERIYLGGVRDLSEAGEWLADARAGVAAHQRWDGTDLHRRDEDGGDREPGRGLAVPTGESPRECGDRGRRIWRGDLVRGIPPVWDERVPGGGLECGCLGEAVPVHGDGAG